ncbi:hypothetical protein BH20ACT15_BH20ACT15_14270 [soil metagenome]
MNQDPLISGGVVKAALVILFAGAIGVGAYAFADSGFDLPNIDFEDLGQQTTTNLQDTDLSDTTINGGPDAPAVEDTFTTASFAAALEAARSEAGSGRPATRVVVNEVQTQFILGAGDEAEAISVRADSGEVVREEATITITGNAKIDDFGFALGSIKPAAIDRMLARARKLSGASDFEPTVLSLERGIPFGERAVRWTINAQGGGRNLLFRANLAGRAVRNDGGAGVPIPPAALDAQKLGDCVAAAGQDTDEILACLEDAG